MRTHQLTVLLVVTQFGFLLNSIEAIAQNESLPLYFPNGTRYGGNAENINQINDELEQHGRVFVTTPLTDKDDYSTLVGYKLFTDKPLWIITENPKNIDEALSKFNIEEFFNSWEFEFELEKYIEEGG